MSSGNLHAWRRRSLMNQIRRERIERADPHEFTARVSDASASVLVEGEALGAYHAGYRHHAPLLDDQEADA